MNRISTASPAKRSTPESLVLSAAVRPAGGSLALREGYRLDSFRDPISRARIPMVTAAVSSDRLFDVFTDLLLELDSEVHVILETSHDASDDAHADLQRGHIDLPVLLSHLCDFEDLMINDGCTGVAVLSPRLRVELQLDEHKHLCLYGKNLKRFTRVLRQHGLHRIDDLQFVFESGHFHHSLPRYADEFQQLAYRLGAGDPESILSDEEEWSN